MEWYHKDNQDHLKIIRYQTRQSLYYIHRTQKMAKPPSPYHDHIDHKKS